MTSPAIPVPPAGFRFGAATAAHQTGGAHDEDGRGPFIRDSFSHGPGRTVAGGTGDTAADHHGTGPVRITENDTVAADDTLTRTPKDSYRCCRDPISAHRAVRKDAR
jgi:hypothetical protein